MQAEFAESYKPKDNSKKIAEIEKEIEKINKQLDTLTLQLAEEVITAERYSRVAKIQEQKLADLKNTLIELKTIKTSSDDSKRQLNRLIEELEKIVNLEDDAINEGLFERITKKIVVYPLNVIEVYLSFMTMPIRLQYRTSGKGDFYKVEFKLLTQSEFEELMKDAPRNEIPNE